MSFPFRSHPIRATLLALVMIAGVGHAACAQLVVDTARGFVGREVAFSLRWPGVPDSGEMRFSATLSLGNETVFYPERLVAPAGSAIIEPVLFRIDERTYRITATIRPSADAGDTLFSIAGEALAGYDSICIVTFTGIAVDSTPLEDARGAVITHSIGQALPYIRFARLEQSFPNPARRYSTVTWYFQIDKPTSVRFSIYTITGERLIEHDFGEMPAGRHKEVLEIGYDVPSAVYLARLSTDVGEDTQFFHVIR